MIILLFLAWLLVLCQLRNKVEQNIFSLPLTACSTA